MPSLDFCPHNVDFLTLPLSQTPEHDVFFTMLHMAESVAGQASMRVISDDKSVFHEEGLIGLT